MIKAALHLLGLPAGPVRPPLVDATPDRSRSCARDLRRRADVAGGERRQVTHPRTPS